MPLIYKQLRAMAGNRMRRERPGHTLQPTELVHEVYLRLTRQRLSTWKDRAHFFAVAAIVMRQVLVDHARARHALRRGGGATPIELTGEIPVAAQDSGRLLALDEALSRLAKMDPRQSRIVELRFFGGLTEEEIAGLLGISVRTVKRDWSLARAWLHAEVSK
jgi:RNA polymerase sigma factor (TIGR02999 family)